MSHNKLKVLCLHGFSQNATIFYKKSGFLRTALKNFADFEYISGPVNIQEAPQSIVPSADQPIDGKVSETKEFQPLQAWFRHAGTDYLGFDETLKILRDHILKEGPFDGIMGFSQGAMVASLLSVMIERRHPLVNPNGDLPDFKFAIIISGFTPRLEPFKTFFDAPVKTPSLHVIGETDTTIEPEWSRIHSNSFLKPDIVLHPGG
ncbi:hypothetical protein DSO57_1035587 [Entomophthora muscae]|nr:hypothetical protein DSO57_1035587 [Entomophthora muscae]